MRSSRAFAPPGRRVVLASLLGMLLLLGVAAPPRAAGAPAGLETGFVDDFVFQSNSAAVRAAWLSRAASVNASWVRLTARWNLIAPAARPRGFHPTDPADPHYNWANLDAAVRSATAAHENILLQLLAAPRWAFGPHPAAAPPAAFGAWRPNPVMLGQFARAAAMRYSGNFPDPAVPGARLPRVRFFQIWNEPNLRIYLAPQWVRTRSGFAPASPVIYRRMLNAAYRAIKQVQADAVVLAAGTAPYGDAPGVDRMHPVVFLRELLCLHGPALRRERCPDPAHLDVLDHHPYSLTPTVHAFSSEDVSVPDFGRLGRVVQVAERSGRILPRGPKPFWDTEIYWDSNPPDHTSPISLATQARYVSLAFYELWRQHVGHVFWFGLRDLRYKSLAGAGVFSSGGAPKPSATAFRFPFVALPLGRRQTRFWGRAPAPGPVTIELRQPSGWRPVRSVRAGPGGIFLARGSFSLHGTLRARQGLLASLGWQVR